MPIFNARPERVYFQVTDPFPTTPTIPNSAGAATLAAADFMEHVRLEINPDSAIILPSAKSGSLGRLPGVQGRRGGSWRGTFPFKCSGTAGTKPDMDQILQAMFGKAAVVTAGTSVAYSLDDVMMAVTGWSFLTPDVAQTPNRVFYGGLVETFEIATGQGDLLFNAGGPFTYALLEPNFASYTTAEKAGLTSYPNEPASPAALGSTLQAFAGSATINGVTTFPISSFTIRCNLSRRLRSPFGSFYPTVPIAGVREITLDLELFMDDSTALNNLRLLAHNKTSTFDASLVFGTVAGNIATFFLNNLTLSSDLPDDSAEEWVVRFSNCPASVTSAAVKDELTLTLT